MKVLVVRKDKISARIAKDSTACPVCGWPYSFPELSVHEAYKKCIAIHSQGDKL